MDHQITSNWKGKLAFEADVRGHKMMMDAREDVGGENRGASPKMMLLAGLAGCTGIDIGIMINKMRIEVEDIQISVGGNLTEDQPSYYKEIEVVYTFVGSNLDKAKIERAVKLSWEKYCGVAEMLRQAADMRYEIRYTTGA